MTDNRKPDRENQALLDWCEQILLFTQRVHKEGHITEQIRYRINESILQESFIKGRLLEGSLPHNPSGSQLGPISTSVMVAIAGEKSPVVQTRDIIGGGDVKGNNNKVSTNSPIHIGDSTMQKGYQPSERLLSML